MLPEYGFASRAMRVQAFSPLKPLLVIDPVVPLVYSSQTFQALASSSVSQSQYVKNGFRKDSPLVPDQLTRFVTDPAGMYALCGEVQVNWPWGEM